MGTWDRRATDLAVAALHDLGDPQRAAGAAAYMKHVAPFLGVPAPERRRALKAAWQGLEPPTSEQLGCAARRLFALDEREYHYAAYDLVDRWIDEADASFLATHARDLLTTTPWWDTVDGLVNAAVSPLCRRYDATSIVEDWSESGDRWLVRAAIGHQRGWRDGTDVDVVLRLCDRHWADREFFVAKAIGWALRDLTSIDAAAVTRFLDGHPAPNRVARREAERGLSRA